MGPGTGAELTLSTIGDWRAIMRTIESLTPKTLPGVLTRYHAVSFGWIVAGLVECVVAKFRSEIAELLNTRVLKVDWRHAHPEVCREEDCRSPEHCGTFVACCGFFFEISALS